MQEYGLFNNDSEDYSSEQAVEADFYSREEAEAALARYSPEDALEVHECEELDKEDDEPGRPLIDVLFDEDEQEPR